MERPSQGRWEGSPPKGIVMSSTAEEVGSIWYYRQKQIRMSPCAAKVHATDVTLLTTHKFSTCLKVWVTMPVRSPKNG